MNKTTLLLGLVVALTVSATTIFAQKKVRKFDTLPTNEPPAECRRPADFTPFRYKYTLSELRDRYTEEFRVRAARVMGRVDYINEQGDWKPSQESLLRHECPEWFEDAKFGMFVDWGLWSIPAWAGRRESGAAYPDWYEKRMYGPVEKYHDKYWGEDFERDDFIPLFKAERYNPDEIVRIAAETGIKYVVPFTKHHTGYCLWDSSFTFRNSKEMGPGRDLMAPLVEACRREGLKFGFYFSVDEWQYPLLDKDNNIYQHVWDSKLISHDEPYEPLLERIISGKVPVRNFAQDYIIPQAVEFIDRFSPDLIWFDGEWASHVDYLGSYHIAAYYYNTVGRNKPVAINDRYGLYRTDSTRSENWLRGRIGDYYTSEYHDLTDDKKSHPWEECRGLSQSFGYNWEDRAENIISTQEFIDMFVRIVSEGGNLLFVVNLDGQGAIPQLELERLRSIGDWLRVNGEGIYATRAYKTPNEGSTRYTRSKDHSTVYAIVKEFKGRTLSLKSVRPAEGSQVTMLGSDTPLKWRYDERSGSTIVTLPQSLSNPDNRPCAYAWTLKFKVK